MYAYTVLNLGHSHFPDSSIMVGSNEHGAMHDQEWANLKIRKQQIHFLVIRWVKNNCVNLLFGLLLLFDFEGPGTESKKLCGPWARVRPWSQPTYMHRFSINFGLTANALTMLFGATLPMYIYMGLSDVLTKEFPKLRMRWPARSAHPAME